MAKSVFLFPGVGSQHVGMGKEFFENFKVVRDTFEEAGDVLKMDLVKTCFSEAGKTDLSGLRVSQSSLLTLSAATFRLYMEEIGHPPQYCMGHSLGEYSALYSAGVVRFTDVLAIVQQRGDILDDVAASRNGIMAWVINLDNTIVEKICRERLEEGEEIYISAYDAPKQSSISGAKEVVMSTGRILEKEGAIVYPLKLNGPFHSPLVKPAAERLCSVLSQYEYRQPIYPVIANHSATPYESKESVIDNLCLQLVRPVHWQNSVRYLLEQGIQFAVELGPDRVLKHLMKSNTDSIGTFSLGNMKDLNVIKEWDKSRMQLSRRGE